MVVLFVLSWVVEEFVEVEVVTGVDTIVVEWVSDLGEVLWVLDGSDDGVVVVVGGVDGVVVVWVECTWLSISEFPDLAVNGSKGSFLLFNNVLSCSNSGSID